MFELIGQGAAGTVYKAHDTVMGRDVAIKILPADRANEPGFRARFSREALIAARLTDPHIIPVHDTGEIDGQLYLVMPIINGVDLEVALQRDGPMTPARAVRMVEQIAAALDAAHAHGLVHRDVKPSNALMTDQGFVYLIDFGLAQDGTGAKLTAESRTAGTWAYMAPERMMSDVIDARADVYSLTCLLYECLTGEMPFPGDRVALQMTAHLATPPPKPSERRSAVPAGFDDVIARGMAKQPDDRYPSAGELAMAAAAALATPPGGQTTTAGHHIQVATQTPKLVDSPSPRDTAPLGLEDIPRAGMGAASFPWPPPPQPDRPPYLGWEPFQPVDAGVFFGRDAEVARAMDALRGMRASDETLFVVLGASGAGKSCFLRAGIVPRLQRQASKYLVLDIVRPELKALTGACGLAQAICTTRQRLGLAQPPLGDIKEACASGDVARLRTWLLECRKAANRQPATGATDDTPVTLVLPLDRAEELFTSDAGVEAAGLLALIRDLALGTNGQDRLPLIVAATIRTDRYELMQTAPQLAGLQTKQFDLRPMDATQFNRVITGPSQRSTDGGRPLYLDEELVRHLLADATGGADTLPLLSLTLAWLYRDYGSTGRLTLEPYAKRGGIDGVVQAEIHEILSSDPDERAQQLKLLRAAFIPWLATINPDNDQPMRRLARWADLPDDSRPLLERFLARRLLIKDLRDGEVIVEVALESLLRQWGDLSGWLADEVEDLKAADALERSAAEWEKKRRDEAWLLRGSQLAAAENLAAKTGFRERLNQTHDYLLASRHCENERAELEKQRQRAELEAAKKLAAAETQAREQAQESAAALRQRSRVLRAVIAATSVIAVIAVVGAATAVIMFNRATRQARDALAAQLDAQASLVFSGTIAESDIRALAATLAARQLRSNPAASRGAFYTATAALNTTRIIIPTQAPVNTVAISPDRHTLASGGENGNIQLWNLTDPAHPGPLGPPLQGHSASVAGVAFSPDGHTLASGSHDGTIQLWNLTDPAHPGPLGPPLEGHSASVAGVAFSPDGHTLASGSDDGTIRLWNLTDPAHPGPLGPPLQGHSAGVASVAFGPDGNTLASGSVDDTVRLWDVTDPAQPGPLGQPLTGHHGTVWSIAFGPDGHTLTTGSHDGTIRLWNLNTVLPVRGHTGPVRSAVFSPDVQTLASGGDDATIALWDLTNPGHPRQLGKPLRGHTRTVQSLAFSPDGHTLASGSDDTTIALWDLTNPGHPRQLGKPLRGHTRTVQSLAFSPDGHTLASGSDDTTIALWDLTDPAHARQLGKPLYGYSSAVLGVAFSPDGRLLASGSGDDTVVLWNLTDPAHPSPLGHPLHGHSGYVNRVAFSPDGHTLASGSSDHTVQLWDLTNLTPAGLGQPLRGHTDSVLGVAFSPDGHTLASGSSDHTVQLWDLTNLTPAGLGQPLRGHTDSVLGVAFSPDGHTLVSSSADATVRVWPTPLDATVTVLCSKLTSNISRHDWREWISPDVDYIALCPNLPVPR
ncbi:WD40 repeat domain-containing serine/threonine protein kinase [Mycobacterium pseudoshottsii]|uniref:WD40 repeat domain-containing serine/threonine protein kinase n=1 Tax=Mycobacterium pseudoshottsii TaxID=265949 RepID=UPI001E358BC9|nr:protein kinase [Mycobacterium pseudoshottsii]